MAPNVVRSAISIFFEYDTPRIVHIKSKKVGVINRFLQLVIIGYIIGYAIIFKKGYQKVDTIQSAVTTKVKGVAFLNGSEVPNIESSLWDVADYVVPAQENNALFVITNLIVTPNQRQGICGEDKNIPGANCTTDATCALMTGKSLPTGNGILTGVCNTTSNTCEVRSWCPIENGDTKVPKNPVLLQSKDFTVFIKNNIEFPYYNIKRRNILGIQNDSQLKTCRYNPSDPIYKFCPIFVLGDIVAMAGEDYKNMSQSGGVMQVLINWDCNLDLSLEDCVPKYTFRRLDSADFSISKGFNFRYAKYYRDPDGTEVRTLYKAFGIKYIITVIGQAGKFNVVPLLLNIGSGLGLLAMATILCDVVVLYVLKAKNVYREKKYLNVVGDDAYKTMENETDNN
ncbi:P2X purinoceptor 4-like isoform X3 [Mizuhopecten yessoensis]|uniref:P2X purinoceptor 4 n=1 Tax=Mizuhopecten yessoensis TaxID=6573 RepID=A0A210PQS5_MIZYE|nr:P2X purinoceptor 4-like isoform X3 [Mizuhopecten yessoensis]OWF38786.1 P2X purinoceptor 4 [Mizuhopecten yessoensis]